MCAKITVVVPSLNQGKYLEEALQSIFLQPVEKEVIVIDGGSTDNSLEIIKKYADQLHWWRSAPDEGQAAAINEGIKKGDAPFIGWLNADDLYLPNGLKLLSEILIENTEYSTVYGQCILINSNGKFLKKYWTAPFSQKHLANRCLIAQPATLMRRKAWEEVGGLDESLQMALDYDLWWRLSKKNKTKKFYYLRKVVAATRYHYKTKTNQYRHTHYREAMSTVRKHYGFIPIKWYLCWPFRVIIWDLWNRIKS